jgi:hypothetical protein
MGCGIDKIFSRTGRRASALLKFLADRCRLKIDVTAQLVYSNDYFGTIQWEWYNPYQTRIRI